MRKRGLQLIRDTHTHGKEFFLFLAVAFLLARELESRANYFFLAN